jgi:hypothetical protein
MEKIATIGSRLRRERTRILDQREEQEKARKARIEKPLTNLTESMKREIREWADGTVDFRPSDAGAKKDIEDVIVEGKHILPSIDLKREYADMIREIENESHSHPPTDDFPSVEQRVASFLNLIYKNFIDHGVGRELIEFCKVEELNFAVKMSEKTFVIECAVLWWDD